MHRGVKVWPIGCWSCTGGAGPIKLLAILTSRCVTSDLTYTVPANMVLMREGGGRERGGNKCRLAVVVVLGDRTTGWHSQ